MAEHSATWAVVAMVDEAPDLTCAFAGWHLALGASEVHLYLDRPDDPVFDRLRHVPGVLLTRCDRAYWQDVHRRGRPYVHMMRQRMNATHAYLNCGADWLIHIDADEYLSPTHSVSLDLASVPSDLDCMVFMNDERAFLEDQPHDTIFSGVFRRRLPNRGKLDRRFYGPDAQYLRRGFTGHTAGKAAVRTRRSVEVGVHKPFWPDTKPKQNLEAVTSTVTTLLHFEGITPLGWAFKRVRKAHSISNRPGQTLAKHRAAQIDYMLNEAVDPVDFMAFHDRLCVLDKKRSETLQSLDLLYHRPMDLVPAEVVLGQALNLRPETFDAWLWETKESLLTDYGFTRQAPEPGAPAAIF